MRKSMKTTRNSWVTLLGLPAALVAMAVWQSGCGNGDTSDGGGGDGGDETSTPDDASDDGSTTSHDHDEHGDHADADSGDEVATALASLSPEDRELAEVQKTCPVGGGPLGGMGVPIKVVHNERPVFLCCEHCKGDFESDPEKYLAALDGDGESSDSAPESTDETESTEDSDSDS